MIALAIGIGLLLVAALINFFHQQQLKEQKQMYADELNDVIDDMAVVANDLQRVTTRLQNEELSLADAVEEFKRDRDPDVMFPNMEGSIRECNVISNHRLLVRLNKDIFGEK